MLLTSFPFVSARPFFWVISLAVTMALPKTTYEEKVWKDIASIEKQNKIATKITKAL